MKGTSCVSRRDPDPRSDMSTTEIQEPQQPIMKTRTPGTAEAAVPHIRIRPPSGWSALHISDMWHYRDLFMALAMRDVKLRYKQTALGVIWVILQPLLGAGIFSFVFGKIAKMPSDGLPYIVFAFAGMLGWQAFNSTLTKASACVVGNSQLVSKVYFPRLILPLSTVLSSLIDFAIGLVIMAALMLFFRITPGIGLLLMPVVLFFLLLLAVGLGFYTSALMVQYRDLQHAIPALMPFLLYASPVAIPVSQVPVDLLPYYFLNPLAGLIEVFRWSLLGTGDVHVGYVLYSAGMSVGVFIFGVVTFKRMERRFADVI
jgi:lipopolysaccharide transport system permease protein